MGIESLGFDPGVGTRWSGDRGVAIISGIGDATARSVYLVRSGVYAQCQNLDRGFDPGWYVDPSELASLRLSGPVCGDRSHRDQFDLAGGNAYPGRVWDEHPCKSNWTGSFSSDRTLDVALNVDVGSLRLALATAAAGHDRDCLSRSPDRMVGDLLDR